MAEKILYGVVYTREDFDHFIRIKGTQTRFAQKGKEWFLLNSDYRVIGIGESKEHMAGEYLDVKRNGWAKRLHNIEVANKGRCSKERCKEIFDSLKGNNASDSRSDIGNKVVEIAKQLLASKYQELGKLSFKKSEYSNTVSLYIRISDSSPYFADGKEGKKAHKMMMDFLKEVRKQSEPVLDGNALDIGLRDSMGFDL